MPFYSYICKQCGKGQEIFRQMNDVTIPVCCDTAMFRDFQNDLPHVSGGEYKKPIHSDALAINPEQRTEHERLFPNVKLDNECRPIFSNYKDHNDYLKKTGFTKKRQKTKPKGKRIA